MAEEPLELGWNVIVVYACKAEEDCARSPPCCSGLHSIGPYWRSSQ